MAVLVAVGQALVALVALVLGSVVVNVAWQLVRRISPLSRSLLAPLLTCRTRAARTQGPDQASPRLPLCPRARVRRQLRHGPAGLPRGLQGKGALSPWGRCLHMHEQAQQPDCRL